MSEASDTVRHLADSIRSLSRSFQMMAEDHRTIELGKSDVLLFRQLKDSLPRLESAFAAVEKRALVECEENEAALRSEKEKFSAKSARLAEEREDFETWRSRMHDEAELAKADLLEQSERERLDLKEEFGRRKVEAVERAGIEVRELREDTELRYTDLRERAHRENSALREQLWLQEKHVERLRAETVRKEADLEAKARLLQDEKMSLETELAELKPELAGSRARLDSVQEGANREIESLKAEKARSEARMERVVADESEREAAAIEDLKKKVEEESIASPGDPTLIEGSSSGGQAPLPAVLPGKGVRSQDALGVWAFGLSNQVRNNLGVIASTTQLCIDSSGLDTKTRERLEMVLKNVSEATEVVEEFLRLSQPVDPSFECGSVQELMAGLAETLVEKCGARKIDLDKDFPPVLGEAMFDADRLEEGLLAVAENALDATPTGGTVALSARRSDDGAWFEITIRDNGAGMRAEEREKAFDPFFSTKKGKMGLGLCAARGIVAAHGGTLELESAPGKGTTVRVRIPAGSVPAR